MHRREGAFAEKMLRCPVPYDATNINLTLLQLTLFGSTDVCIDGCLCVEWQVQKKETPFEIHSLKLKKELSFVSF